MGFESFGKVSKEKPKRQSGALMNAGRALAFAAALIGGAAQAPENDPDSFVNRILRDPTIKPSENIEDRRGMSMPIIMRDLVTVKPLAWKYPLRDFAYSFAHQPNTALDAWSKRKVTVIGPAYVASRWTHTQPEELRAAAQTPNVDHE